MRHYVADRSELGADGSKVITEIEGQEIAVIRYDGELYAMANYCVHQGGPLCEGALVGMTEVGEDGWEWSYDEEKKNVMCPWHGWRFDITTGRSVNDGRYSVPTFDVETEDGRVYVVF